MSSRTISFEHLTQAIKMNLIRKVEKYVRRSAYERDKVVIFTDNADLWKGKGPNGQSTSIRTDEPLPPIPLDYNRSQGYNIVDEMNWFIGEYTGSREYDIDWNLYNTGDDDHPQVHIHFAQDHLEPAWLFLKSSPSAARPHDLPPTSSIARSVEVIPAASASAGAEVVSPMSLRSIGREVYRFLSLSTISERSSVTSAPSSSRSSHFFSAHSSISSLETYEDSMMDDVFEEESTLEPISSATDDDVSSIDDQQE